MADSDEAAAAAAAARAAEQARLRKEKREAKILAGGAARLNKISGVAGMPRGKSLIANPGYNSYSPCLLFAWTEC